MKFIIDISHPAHYHFFKNTIAKLKEKGHAVLVVSRDKDITLELLDSERIEHTCLSKQSRGVFGLATELFIHEKRLFKLIRAFQPDAVLEIGGTFIVHACKLTKTPSIVFYDTENASLSNAITYPFADVICTPAAYKHNLGRKHVRYEGYQELAYLHPDQFTPAASILHQAGLSPGERFALVRFVGWTSGHDISLHGFTERGKKELVEKLSSYVKVFISSESRLPKELEKYTLPIKKSKVHHLLAFADLYIGESATMASESAMLGIPAVFVSPVGRGYTDEQEEKYGLVINFIGTRESEPISKSTELLRREEIKQEWQKKRQKMLSEKVNVTDWTVEFVEKFAASRNAQA